jgi:DnaJ homolog subfamily C member 19
MISRGAMVRGIAVARMTARHVHVRCARTAGVLSAAGSSEGHQRSGRSSFTNDHITANKHNHKYIHSSARRESVLIVGGVALIAGSVLAQYGLEAYKGYAASKPAPDNSENSESSKDGSKTADASPGAASSAPWYSTWFAKTFYDGGFEDKMSRREAALILGVRESATLERIKDAHRRILLLNHPDRGGSAYMAAKINEAKDLLLKGK